MPNNPRTLAERADLQDLVAERAADVARYAEAEGYLTGADIYWKLAQRCRVKSLKLRALSTAREVRGWRI